MAVLSMGTTISGHRVVVCYCNGGPIHEWKPVGSGASMRVFQCPDDEPVLKPAKEDS